MTDQKHTAGPVIVCPAMIVDDLRRQIKNARSYQSGKVSIGVDVDELLVLCVIYDRFIGLKDDMQSISSQAFMMGLRGLEDMANTAVAKAEGRS